MKIIQIVNALPSLQKLAGQDLSIKKLYKVSKLLGNLENEIAFYNEQRSKILSQYCDVVGNQYVPRQGCEDKMNAAMNELLDTEVECDIKEVVLGTNENIKMSFNDLMALQGFVSIEGDE